MSDRTEHIPIKLALVDELGLLRASLGRFLASEPCFQLVGECGTAAQALDLLGNTDVDIVLVDFEVGAERAIDLIEAARRSGYMGRFLIIAATLDVWKSAHALKLGASGIFLKSEALERPLERLVQAIKLVAGGDLWIDSKVIHGLADLLTHRSARSLDSRQPPTPLEQREQTVLLGILQGLSNRKIGENIGLSESSVKNAVQKLFSRAGVKTRSRLVRVALEGSLGDTFKRSSVNHMTDRSINGSNQLPRPGS